MNTSVGSWSYYFQNPEFLERSRMFILPPEMHPVVRKWCGVKEGARILDVGCGTGFFTRVMAGGREDVTAVGIDIEEPFIEYAGRIAGELDLPIRFIRGDALHLPFEDHSFDIVTSHTFFTNISDPERAMSEMKRVVRPGGLIASVTAMAFIPSALSLGTYPEDCTWQPEFLAYFSKFYRAYNKLDPFSRRAEGIKPVKLPHFFVEQGLLEVSAYPLGKLFCLSNAAIPLEEKRRYIDLYEISELKKLDAYMSLPEMGEYVTSEDAVRFRELIFEKCNWHRANIGENSIWEWQGDANILLTGRTPE